MDKTAKPKSFLGTLLILALIGGVVYAIKNWNELVARFAFFRWLDAFWGLVGFVLFIFASLGDVTKERDSPLNNLRRFSLGALSCLLVWMGAIAWAAHRPNDKFFLRIFGRSDLPEWAVMARLKILGTLGLAGMGGLIYCLKRKSKLLYGYLEVVFAVIANWALSDRILAGLTKHQIGAQDFIGVAGAFYVFTRGIGNIIEGLEEEEKISHVGNAAPTVDTGGAVPS